MLLCALLAGSIVGQLAFGVLGDWLGRKRMYGRLLVIIMVATVLLALSAKGAEASMSISALLFVWRFCMGIGIGGDYPLSASITSEFAPTKHRSTMLAWVFLMQPAGQFAGTLVAIIVTAAFRPQMQVSWEQGENFGLPPECIQAIDRAWRIIVGLGAIPALVAYVIRSGIPESPRFTMDILFDTNQAVRDTEGYFVVTEESTQDPTQPTNKLENVRLLGDPLENKAFEEMAWRSSNDPTADLRREGPFPLVQLPAAAQNPDISLGHVGSNIHEISQLPSALPDHTQNPKTSSHRSSNVGTQYAFMSRLDESTYSKIRIWTSEFREWLASERNGIHLAGTTLTWGLLDFSFYGLGMSSASTIQEIWNVCADDPWPDRLNNRAIEGTKPTVYELLLGNAWHSTVVVSVGALLGGLALIYLIQRLRPKHIQIIFFAVLGLLLILVGALFKPLIGTGCSPLLHPSYHWGVVVLYVFCQVFFNLGANATTFIVSISLNLVEALVLLRADCFSSNHSAIIIAH